MPSKAFCFFLSVVLPKRGFVPVDDHPDIRWPDFVLEKIVPTLY